TVAKDGSIFAAGVGTKQTSSPISVSAPPPVAPSSAPASAPGGPATVTVQRAAAPPPATLAPASTGVSGGSEIYRIHPDGHPQKAWSHGQDVVYALGFDAQGRTLAGAGNRGMIYRLD